VRDITAQREQTARRVAVRLGIDANTADWRLLRGPLTRRSGRRQPV